MEFLAMGKHGFYIWGAYGVTALVVLIEVVSVRMRARQAARLAAGARDGER